MPYMNNQDAISEGSDVSSRHSILESCASCQFPSLGDDRRPAKQGFSSADALIFNAGQIQDFSSKQNVSMASIIETSWAVVLGAYAGTTSVCFGIQDHVKPEAETAADFAVFSKYAVFQFDLGLDHSFLETVRRVQALKQRFISRNEWCHRLESSQDLPFNSEVRFRTNVENFLDEEIRMTGNSSVRKYPKNLT
jgi:hypothetical protein